MSQTSPDNQRTLGYSFAISAFIFWSLVPLFWVHLTHVSALEVLAHRVVWTVPVGFILMLIIGQSSSVRQILKQPKTLGILGITTFFVAINWGTYIWSVNHGQILQASLGYFLNPLINIIAGLIIFKESLSKLQWASIALAIIGVAVTIIMQGQIPIIGLTIAVSFGVYGTLRKVVKVEAVPGLLVEALILLPIALGYLIWLNSEGSGQFLQLGNSKTHLFLMATGLVTAIPLLLYVSGSRRIPMSNLGMLQYITPSGLFFIAIFLYGEQVHLHAILTFGFIWAGLLVYIYDMQNRARKTRKEKRRLKEQATT
jgi:chloramphenicol-sensitive protein RarD